LLAPAPKTAAVGPLSGQLAAAGFLSELAAACPRWLAVAAGSLLLLLVSARRCLLLLLSATAAILELLAAAAAGFLLPVLTAASGLSSSAAGGGLAAITSARGRCAGLWGLAPVLVVFTHLVWHTGRG